MPRKENTKAKTWERDRRNRMNGYFQHLSDLLPPQLEGRKRNKIDILIHASKYIKELHSRTDDLFHAKASDAHKEELTRLKRLVSQLISRTQLLSNLLKDAGITVPAEPALEKISPLKWSNKINVVPGTQITDTAPRSKGGKKKKVTSTKLKKNLKITAVKTKRTDKEPIHNKCFLEKSKCTLEDQENHVTSGSSDTSEKGDKSSSSLLDSSLEESAFSNTSIEESPPKPEIKNHKKVKRKKKNVPKTKKNKRPTNLSSLAAGTYVFSGGKIVPVVAPMQSLTSNIIVNTQTHHANPIILNNAQQGHQMIVVQPLQANHFQTVSAVQTMTLNTVPNIQTNMLINSKDWAKNVKTIVNSTKIGGTKGILPKIKEVTETTMTYKVPIPAIHKEKSDKNESNSSTLIDKPSKGKNVVKATKNNQLSNAEAEADSQKSKEDKNDNSSKNKSSVNKLQKRNWKSSLPNETAESKKKKLQSNKNESENQIENIQTKSSVILSDAVTCKSIENLRQVINKIGEDSSYPIVDNVNRKIDEQKCDNLLNEPVESDKVMLNADKTVDENKNTQNESTTDKKTTELSTSIMSSEKELTNIENMTEHVNFSEKVSNEIIENNKNQPLTPTEIANENKNSKTMNAEKPNIQVETECVINETMILSNNNDQNCNIGSRLDNMLQSETQNDSIDDQQSESNKIFLNLDTNTTMKLEGSENKIISIPPTSTSPTIKVSTEDESLKQKNNAKDDQTLIKTIPYSPSNSFVPINHKTDSLHSDLSNDIFASLQVPSSSNNSESISPTAAFLMAFPIVSSLTGKTEVLDDDMKDEFKYSSQTPPMLLQIGAIEPNNFKINSRTSANDNLETVDSTGISVQTQIKSSAESIPSITTVTPVTTTAKTIPRIISSQNLTQPFKIVPVSSEQINRQLDAETSSSIQIQENNSTNQNENSTVNNTLANRDQSSIISDSIDRSITSNIQNYPVDNKSRSTFNYSKDMSLTSISSSMANEILNKYISTTSLSTNTMHTETSSKYNSISQYVTQECQTSVSNNCAKENVDRHGSQYFPTDRDLCKLQICPMEAFTERSNEYSSRNKDNSFTNNAPVENSSPETLNKNIQISMNPEKTPKVSNQNIVSSNFHSIKKLENKGPPPLNLDTNTIYPKKPNEITNTNTYIGSCDNNKINKKIMNVTSQSSNSGQKVTVPARSNVFPQQTEGSYIVTTNYEDNNPARSTTTVANNTSNFSILSWTTFSPLSSNNNSFPQYEQNPVTTDIPKNICENFNYLPLSKDNVSLSNTLSQSSYSTVDSQMPNFDKSKNKLSIDTQKRSYNDMNKSRNMRLSQPGPPLQKSTRTHSQASVSNSEYKFPSENNKNKYKYPMDIDYMQNNYSSSLDLAPHLQHNQQQQQQQQQQQHQHTQQTHQSSTNSKSSNSNQQLHSLKSDKSNYMLADYDTHPSTNFSSDTANVQTRYSNNHEVYSSSSFKYASDNKSQQIHSKYQPTSQVSTSSLQQDNSIYSNNSNNNNASSNNKQQHVPQQQQQHQSQSKTKSEHTMRPPVNWMMTPEIKHNSNIGDIILPPIGKELDFCQNNIFAQTPGYNQTSSNHQFYNNYDMSTPTFHNIPVLQSESKRNVDTTYYPEEQTFSWSPSKNLSQTTEQNQSLKTVETSTMPTLVGDLALGTTNVSEKQNFLFGQMPIRSSGSEIGKESLKNKEANVTSRDYQGIVNSQNAQQHSSHGMPFLSVSQLVDHEKVDKNQQQQTHNTGNHHHGNHHQSQHHQQPQQQQQPTPRKQRKSNSSPRASAKRQMEMRQKQSTNTSNEHIHRQHEAPKTSSVTSSVFVDSNYQQQPQQQQQQQQKYNPQNNDTQWRSRNCKSNYTAEALIGTNNTDSTSHSEKNLPKYSSSNYSQNKFSSSLSSDPMSINYFPNVEEASSGYGQVINQNFNHSYAYSSNANIYQTSNFITNIPNSSANYMMSLHENTPDYLESNNFLLPPNVSTTSITTPLLSNVTDGVKSHHHHHPHQPYKHQNCSDKRIYFSQQKKTRRKQEITNTTSSTTSTVQNFDFPGLSSPLDDYHHTSSFLPPPNPLYQNQPYSKTALPPPPPPPPPTPIVSSSSNGGSQGTSVTATTSNPMAMTQHHPSGTSLTNFNLSTIFPEINDKVTGYKSSTNGIASGITQPTSHTSTNYSQRSNYTDPMDPMSQASESTSHFNNTGSR